MTPRQVLASWSGWGSTKEGDVVADDIIDTLAKHGYRIVGEGLPLLDHWAHGEGIAHAPVEAGDLVAVSVPCPGRMIRGGIGGQAVTGCSWCGEGMASTAGPHSRDGVTVLVLVAVYVETDRKGQRIVLTRPLGPRDLLGVPS